MIGMCVESHGSSNAGFFRYRSECMETAGFEAILRLVATGAARRVRVFVIRPHLVAAFVER